MNAKLKSHSKVVLILSVCLFIIPYSSALFSDNSSLVQDLYDCGTLSTANATYNLNTSLISTSTCITMGADNITLDLNGFIINGTHATNSYGIYALNRNLIKVQNGSILHHYTGIYFDGSNNSQIKDIISVNNSRHGLSFTSSNNAMFTNITASQNTRSGIYLQYSSNNTLQNLTINTNGLFYFSITLEEVSNSTLQDISLNQNGYGMKIFGNYYFSPINAFKFSSGNIFKNIIITNDRYGGSSGINLDAASSNIFANVTINNYYTGMSLTRVSNNTFTNVTLNNNSYYGLTLSGGQIYVTKIPNKFINYNINGSYPSIKIDDTNNNLFQDSIFFSDSNNSITLDSLSINNTFLNCTYNSSKENVTGGSSLIRQWYLNTQVNYTHNGTAVYQANVSAWNSSNNLQFSQLTDANGNIPQQAVTEYVNNGTRTYWNYTINTTKSKCINYLNSTFSLSDNYLLNILLEEDLINPTIVINSPVNWTNISNNLGFISVNLNVSDLHIKNLIWSFDFGTTNYSDNIVNGTNIIGIYPTQEKGTNINYIVDFWVYDSVDNFGTTSINISYNSEFTNYGPSGQITTIESLGNITANDTIQNINFSESYKWSDLLKIGPIQDKWIILKGLIEDNLILVLGLSILLSVIIINIIYGLI